MAESAEIIRMLLDREMTVAAAESCTGGLLSKLLTDVPGSSGAFLGGVVSYTCPVKERLLGVDHGILESLGPVSKPVARQMAEGVRSLIGADFGVGITGLAGPDGDGSDNPVGLVFVALAGQGWTVCDRLELTGSRGEIRQAACAHALGMLARALA